MPCSCRALVALLLTVATVGAAPPHWVPLGEPGSGGWITSISISPHDGRRILLGGDMLGIGLSTDRGEHWRPTFGLRSYEIGDCTWHPTDPNVVWAGTMSGPYRSQDGGQTWQERREGMPAISGGMYSAPIEKVLFDPTDAHHLLAFGGSSRGWESPGKPLWGAIWESRDDGDHWQQLARLDGNIVGAAYEPGSSQRLFAAVRGQGIFGSEDGGKTWAPRNEGLPGRSVERVIVHPTQPNTLFTCLTAFKPDGEKEWRAGGVYMSTSAGASWQRLGGLPEKRSDNQVFTSGFKGFAVSASNPAVMAAGNAPYDANTVFVTTDSGQTWRAAASKQTVDVAYFAGLNATVIAIDPHDPQALFAAGAEYLVRSLDGGKTWADMTAERVGEAWRGRGYSGLCCKAVYWDPQVANRLFILGMDAGKLWESRDNGASWTYRGQDPWPWGGGNDVALAKDGTGYAATGQFGGNGGILRTTDGTHWKSLSGAAHGLPQPEQGEAEAVWTPPYDSRKVWCCWGGRLYASGDGGQKFAAVPGLEGVSHLAADPRRPQRLFVSGAKSCWLTDDGVTFRPIGGPKVAGKAASDSLGRFYVCAWRSGQRAGLWRWADGVWTRLSDRYYVHNIAIDPTNPRRMIAVEHDHPFHDVCAAQGVWLSVDDGQSWSAANDGLPNLRLEAVGINPRDPRDVVVGSHGSGFFRARWDSDYAPTGSVRYTSTDADAAFAAPDATLRPVTLAAAPVGGDVASPFGFRNGGMTQGTAVPTAWDGAWDKINAARDTTVYKVGPASLRADVDGGSGQVFQQLTVAGGAHLRVTGFIKSRGAVKAQCALQVFNANWTQNQFLQAKYVQGDTDWEAFSAEVTLPEWATRCNVLLLAEGKGQAWLDEVTLTELGAAKP